MFTPRHVRHRRRATRGDEDMFGGMARAIRHFHRVRIDQLGSAENDRHACSIQQLTVDAVQAVDLLGAVGFEGFPIQNQLHGLLRRAAPRRRSPLGGQRITRSGKRGGHIFPAKTVRLFKTLGKMGGVAVKFFRDATDVDAGAAQARAGQTAIIAMAAMHAARFGERNFGSALCRHPRRAHPATAAADDEQVEFISLLGLHR